jgi:HlyD family secretion protein
MNSPYRVHPALHSPVGKTVAFPTPQQRSTEGQGPPPPNRLALLLKLEGELRQLPNWRATIFHALNETVDLIGHAQGFFFRSNNRGGFRCEAASSVAALDARAPLVAALNSVVNRLDDVAKPHAFELLQFLKSQVYPHQFALWVPVADAKGKVFGGFLFMRDDAWPEANRTVAERLVSAYGHSLRVHKPPQLLKRLSLPKWALYGLPVVLLLLAFVPVPMTTLAPFEIVPKDSLSITAPLDGVIKLIGPEPNSVVAAGTQLFQLDTTDLSAKNMIAAQRVVVAEAKLATAQNGAFADKDMKRSVNTLLTELQLAKAEFDLTTSQLQRANVVAAENGLLVYSTKADWMGKPVRTGEKVMEIADPKRVAVRVDVNVHDAIALDGEARVRLFLDADPLHPLDAKIYERSYNAAEIPGGVLAFAVRAQLTDGEAIPPRIGLRGTAQLIGKKVPLGFYLLRRPISELRQHFGI